MSTTTRAAAILGLAAALLFALIQTSNLLGRINQGYSPTYITVYISLALVAIAGTSFLIVTAPFQRSGPAEVLAVADDRDDNRLLSDWRLRFTAGLVFFLAILFTVSVLKVQVQPTPQVINVDPAVASPLAAGHDAAREQLGITKTEEQWLTSFQPAVTEDVVFNWLLPTLATFALAVALGWLGVDLNRATFFLLSIIACAATSGLLFGWTNVLLPTFAGIHADVYTTTPAFYSAGMYSFIASLLNVHAGFPVSIPAHFANNWLVTAGMFIAFAVGTAIASPSFLLYATLRRRRSSA